MTSKLQIKFGPSTAAQHLSAEAAARDLSISRNVVIKALDTGVLPDLRYTTVAKAASLPIITSLADATGAKIPVLRMGVRNDDVSNDPPNDPRTCYGYDITLTCQDLEDSVLRYWPPQYVREVVHLGALPVVAASFVVAFAEITGATPVGDRYKFSGRLVAHTISVIDKKVEVDAPDSPWVDDATALINARLLGGGGGSLTLA
ncbi:hypothetical protein [Calidifontibacter indicus]|uniref:hypothetical protein n=1 Tax=Calidifontibacter indicus TaxID=419650 RepID=UPI003D74CE6D